MTLKFLQKSVVIITALLVVSLVQAAKGSLGDDGTTNYDFKAKKWVEQEVTIPPLPQSKNLVRLEFPNATRKYYIDLKSVTVGKKDRVARYTVVVESLSGVRNLFYEAIRCHEKDYKTYAYSIGKQGFRKMNTVVWRPITETGIKQYRQVLFDFFICNDSAVRNKAKDIIQVLKYPPENDAP